MGASIDIIKAEGSPPAQMSIFIAIRVIAAIRLRARTSQPDMDTLHRSPVSATNWGSRLVTTPQSVLPTTEGQRGLTMNPHNSDESVRYFSIGRLQGAELTDFETHLLQRNQCQNAVRGMVPLLDVTRGPTEHSRLREKPYFAHLFDR